MPYVKQARRGELKVTVLGIPNDPGELNYVLTQVIEDYRLIHGDKYATFNDIMGALEGAKAEFYRRIVAPYEDHKVNENGDVYRVPEPRHPVPLPEDVHRFARYQAQDPHWWNHHDNHDWSPEHTDLGGGG